MVGIGEWVLFFIAILNDDPQGWINQHFGEIVKYGMALIAYAVGFGVLKESVKQLRIDHDKLSTTVAEHCNDEDLHINSRVYDLIKTRFDSMERQLDELKQNPRRRT
jgi:hypothetical protein